MTRRETWWGLAKAGWGREGRKGREGVGVSVRIWDFLIGAAVK